MLKTLGAIVLALHMTSVQAVAPVEKPIDGRTETLSINVQDGETFSTTRQAWFNKAQKICGKKEVKVEQYREWNVSYGDVIYKNPSTGKEEAEEIPARISGIFKCIKSS